MGLLIRIPREHEVVLGAAVVEFRCQVIFEWELLHGGCGFRLPRRSFRWLVACRPSASGMVVVWPHADLGGFSIVSMARVVVRWGSQLGNRWVRFHGDHVVMVAALWQGSASLPGAVA